MIKNFSSPKIEYELVAEHLPAKALAQAGSEANQNSLTCPISGAVFLNESEPSFAKATDGHSAFFRKNPPAKNSKGGACPPKPRRRRGAA